MGRSLKKIGNWLSELMVFKKIKGRFERNFNQTMVG